MEFDKEIVGVLGKEGLGVRFLCHHGAWLVHCCDRIEIWGRVLRGHERSRLRLTRKLLLFQSCALQITGFPLFLLVLLLF